MTASSAFFGQRNAQAVLKHGVLTRYAHYFGGRAGSVTDGKVAFIDGYAGEGRYDDGSPGSPLLLASQAERVSMLGRDVKVALVEQDDVRRAKLSQSLSDHGVQPDQILGGSFQDVADGLLDQYEGHAVLLFVDPFGLAIDRPTLERILKRSSYKQPIDVLYHFSISSVARMGRGAIAGGPGSQQSHDQLDAALGSVDWQSHIRHATDPGEPTQAAIDIAGDFGASVSQSTGLRSTAIPVRNRPGHLPQYVLILFSRNDKAHWDFADVASTAHVDWLHHCSQSEYEAFVKREADAGVLSLFGPEVPDISKIGAHLKTQATEYLVGHLRSLIRSKGALRPVDAIEESYGEMLGRGRRGLPRVRLTVVVT